MHLVGAIRAATAWLPFAMAAAALADETGAPSVDYLRDVKPILQAKCYACHGALKQEAGLRLDTAAAAREGGYSGSATAAVNPHSSLIWQRITDSDEEQRMPQQAAPLSQEQIATLRVWLASGATGPDHEPPESDPRRHWAFQVPRRPAVPVVSDVAWQANPIDAFLAAEHQRHGLTRAEPAERSLLLRRVYLDLIGLPPSRQQLADFLADRSPDAYQRVVENLLQAPQYGERWGRHWMDVWRYSDWYGRRMVPDVWNSAPQIWRWRDWIVKSLNEDKGYDRMLMEMLAADEICPQDADSQVATGYLIRNWYALNPNDWMRSNVEHTAKAFLGLTYNCAHCHDHKYDPISQRDYFAFRAFFEPIGIRQDRVPGEADPGPFQRYEYSQLRKIVRLGAVSIYDQQPEAPTWFYTGGDERNRDTAAGSISPTVPEFLGEVQIQPLELPVVAWNPALRPAIQQTLLAEKRAAVAARQQQLQEARQALANLPKREQQVIAAQVALDKVAFESSGQSAFALSGVQSLMMDASSGRRIVQNTLPELTQLPDGTVIGFRVRILKDAHFNFQLARDRHQGLTAAYVGWVQGRIVSYQPGTFSEFDVGAYDHAAGQTAFETQLKLLTGEDRALLTIRCLADDQILVDQVPVALNGWNPIGDSTKSVSFDARTGNVSLLDDVRLKIEHPDGDAELLAEFDFEPPEYANVSDVIGSDGWTDSPFSQAPAFSLVLSAPLSDELRTASQQLTIARAATSALQTRLEAAERAMAAAELDLKSVEARIAADNARYGDRTPAAEWTAMVRAARDAERAALVNQAEADVLEKQHALEAAQSRPAEDAERANQMSAATQALTAARQALEQAKTKSAALAKSDDYTPLTPTYPTHSTGRRRALAQWIASRDNPLTARVAVNHIWMRHFHAPLVSTVFDFGRNGAEPSHAELLDWLAVELMESEWSMKDLHRLIVTSQAYQMSSAARGLEASATLDPENRFLWRMNSGRMEAEVLRDALLANAGSIDHRQGGQELENSEALTSYRRSLYYSCQPEADGTSEFGMLFDAPDAKECYRRTRSILPQQSLALTNSQLVHQLSKRLSEQLWSELGGDQQADRERFITAVFETILGRRPSDAERQLCGDFVKADLQSPEGSDPPATRAALVRVLWNHNDFITIR